MRRNMGKKVIGIISIIAAINIFTACNKEEDIAKPAYVAKHVESDVINKEEAKEDLEYIKNKVIEVHPNPYGEIGEEEYDKRYNDILGSIHDEMEYGEFQILVQRFLRLSEDSNTEVVFMEPQKYIPLKYDISIKGLWVEEDYEGLKAGDMIKSIGGKSVEEISNLLTTLYSEDNEYTIESKLPELLTDVKVLEYLGVIDEKMGLKIEVIGQNSDNRIHYVEPVVKEGSKNKDNDYSINSSQGIGILEVNNLDIQEDDNENIKKFFKEINALNIKNIVLDLRESEGVSKELVYEILKYIEIEELTDYEVEIKESESAKVEGVEEKSVLANIFSDNKIKPKKSEDVKLFKGDIYVLVSHNTCKTGVEVATIIKDNNAGEILGTYSAYSPNMYGIPLYFETEKTKLRFTVSTSTVIRPSEGEENTLRPDKYIMDGYSESKNIDPYIVELINCIQNKLDNK